MDIVICAGDAVEDYYVGDEYDDFIEWFSSIPRKWKIFMPGNHELSFELGQAHRIIHRMTAKGITVLEDAIEDCDGELIVNSKKAPSKEAIRLDCFASEKKVPVIAIVIK